MWKYIVAFVLATGLLYAGTNTLQTETGAVIQRTHINKFQLALVEDLVPRNTSGVATSLAGNLGTSTYKWLKARIESGYWRVGDIKMHHSYNGAAGPGHGWMLCDGRQVTEAAYNTEHGANTWATYVGSSPLLNLYLPNFTSKYPTGAATTTQDGSVAITFVGNASNQVNLEHSHTVNSHDHKWYDAISPGDDKTYSGGNTLQTFSALADGGFEGITTGAVTLDGDGATDDLYTSAESPGTNNQLSTTQSIRPHSVEVQFYMRIID